jgi:hypothetical protein
MEMQRRLLQFVFAAFCVVPLLSCAATLDWAGLTNIASRYKLPMPPANARLVLAHTETWSVLGQSSTSRDPGIYSPAFLLEDKTNRIFVLRGAERQTLEARPNEPSWRPFSTALVEPKLGGHVVSFDRLSAFICSVQLAVRGDQSTAQVVWQRFSSSEWWSDGQPFDAVSQQEKNPSLLLGRCVFNHLRNQILTQPTNWTGIRTQMAALFAEFPVLKNPQRDEVFDRLTAAVETKAPPPDSIEALLLDWSRRPSKMRHLGLFQEECESEADAPARTIVLRGASAVPDLIALLNDRRITVHEVPAIMNASARIRSVGELAGLLLEEITGVHPSSPWGNPDAAAFQSWLEKRNDMGEEEALAESVFSRVGGKITGVNETPARTLAQKFPERLLALCDKFSKNATAEAQPFSLAEAVASARLSKEIRVKSLSEFAKRGSLEHKRCVLQNLAKVDDKACAQLLAPLLDEMPKDSSGPYWTCPEAGFTHVVMQVEDEEVWRKYVRAAKRSSVGLRMEMMNPLCYTHIGEKNRNRRLAFAAAFLDDTTLRDKASDKTKFEGPCAAFTIPKITVRDFAAMKIAEILGLEESPDEFWTSKQWEGLRNKVSAKLATEKLPKLN